MSLDEYRRKRRPGRTPEPAGGEAEPADGDRPLFVVQRHDARRLHYDLRLEMNGVLASWALPKGLPLEVGERYLAVHTEDHPMQYATFSGVIPKGQYGAGTMEIWDHGSYELVERKRDGGLTVRLARGAAAGAVDAGAGPHGRGREELAGDQEARLARAGGPGGAGRLCADAGDPRRPAARRAGAGCTR